RQLRRDRARGRAGHALRPPFGGAGEARPDDRAGADDRARRIDRELDGAAPALRAADQPEAGGPLTVPTPGSPLGIQGLIAEGPGTPGPYVGARRASPSSLVRIEPVGRPRHVADGLDPARSVARVGVHR